MSVKGVVYMQIDVSRITGRETDDQILFEAGGVKAIQMSFEHLRRLEEETDPNRVNIVKNNIPVYKRLNIKAHILFYKRWYNRDFNISDVMKQFGLEDAGNMKLGRAGAELNQRLGFVHSLMCRREHVLFIEPFFQATKENIHLFHKLKAQLCDQGKSIVVAVTRTEDAFLVQPDIMRLTPDGLEKVETEEDEKLPEAAGISRIKVKAEDKTLFVNIKDIEYIESNEGKVFINISREKFVMESTLQEAEKNLGSHGFYRCHRSYIVNLHKVKEIITWSKNTYSVVISNPEESKIPLSRTKYNEIQNKLITL